MSILVINAGSSSLKFALFEPEAREALCSGVIDWTHRARAAELILRREGREERADYTNMNHRAAAVLAVRTLIDPVPGTSGRSPIEAIGHRIVHGGTAFRESRRIDPGVKAEIARLAELAPLHNPTALEAVEAVEAVLPGVPQVAVFDTAFYTHLPPVAAVYPVPYAWYQQWGIRRFGFHGISHSYCAGRAAELLGRDLTGLRIVSCHLGNGCSATAIRDGVALATTMGFTPLDGLMMGTRAGAIDPGILLYVQRRRGLSLDQLDDILNHGSGMLGVSGISSDVRRVEEAARQGNEQARLALEIYADRIRSAIGALAVTLGGLDALIFTAGVGEHSATLRAAVCHGLECLGVRIDTRRNVECQPDSDVADDASTARVLVIRTREELMVARETRRIVLSS